MTRIGVVVVNYNTRDHLRACLASIEADAADEVVVVDNASTDGSAEMVAAEFPGIVLLACRSNPGFGAAANLGIRRCRCAYVLLLNADTRLHAGALCALADYLDDHPHTAIVGPRLTYPDGRLQVSSTPFPTPLNLFIRELYLGSVIRKIPGLRNLYLATWPHDASRRVPWLLGAALAIRREAFVAVQGFDESFFMYFEETDLCYRLHATGWEVHFAPVTTVVHVSGASALQCRREMTEHLHRSLRLLYRRHYTRVAMLLLRLVLTYVMLRNMLRDAVRLCCARQPARRARLAEDLAIWKQVLPSYWQA